MDLPATSPSQFPGLSCTGVARATLEKARLLIPHVATSSSIGARHRLWPSPPSGVKGRHGAPPRCPSVIRLLLLWPGQRAPLPRSAGGRPLTPSDDAGKDAPIRSKGKPCSEAEPNPGLALAPLRRAVGWCGTCGQFPGVGCLHWGAVERSAGPSGRAASSSTQTLITIVRRAITATRRASSPHRSHHCDFPSAPPNGDHQHHTCASSDAVRPPGGIHRRYWVDLVPGQPPHRVRG